MTTTTTHKGLNGSVAPSSVTFESFDYRSFLDRLSRALPLTDAVVVTSFPRGGLQVTQSLRAADYLLKAYVRQFHTEDRATWQSILADQVVTGDEAWGGQGFSTSRFYQELMRPAGLAHVMAVPLTAPVLAGYPGALHVYRSQEQGAFTESEKSELARIGRELDTQLISRMQSRRAETCQNAPVWVRRPEGHQWVLDEQLNVVVGNGSLAQLDQRLQQQIQQHAQHQLQSVDAQEMSASRLQLPDARGDLWTFRVVRYKHYPALGDGSFVFFCLQPDCCEWSVLRSGDFEADAEMSRLIPSLKFMRENFPTGPGLGEIARTAHLSPFHFHRRFSELMGLTPKHFMLECQIFSAKRQLVERNAELAEIARNCGFAHQSHFTSRFKQATGLTPTRWRRIVGSHAVETQARV